MKLTLDAYLPYKLSVTSNKVSAIIAKAYETRFGLSIPQWRLLAVLNEESPLSQLELVNRTFMDKVMVSRTVSSLIARGLIERRTHSSDKRLQALSLTQDGQAVVDEIIPIAKELEAKILAHFSKEEILTLEGLLDALIERTNEI